MAAACIATLRREASRDRQVKAERLSASYQAPSEIRDIEKSSRSQKALDLCCMRELVTQDAAKLLGISDAGVKARVHRAKLALRSAFDRLGLRRRPCSKHRRMDTAVWSQDSGPSAQVLATRHCSGFGD
jgi:DNA-directed RNA polymerase specialized sigma24 family protein